jgi:hypothetical protein
MHFCNERQEVYHDVTFSANFAGRRRPKTDEVRIGARSVSGLAASISCVIKRKFEIKTGHRRKKEDAYRFLGL